MHYPALEQMEPDQAVGATITARFAARTWRVLPALLLILAFGLSVPLFVCMPVWVDVTYHDLAARNLLRGGVDYRDCWGNNFPTMPWIHVAVRSLVGWSSEALRLVDLLVVVAVGRLLLSWIRRDAIAVRLWCGLALALFYFSTSEMCHAQRDVWMLLPALAAAHLRRRRVTDWLATDGVAKPSDWAEFFRAVCEGLCWGAAIWIKPYAAAPAVAVYAVSSVISRRSGVAWSKLLGDFAGLLTGGLLAGGVGLGWLWFSGSWPYFWDIMLRWNTNYVIPRTWRFVLLLQWLMRSTPWGWTHFLALPLAVVTIMRSLGRPRENASIASAILAAFYLAWTLQAACLQIPHEYVLAAAVFPALALLAVRCREVQRPRALYALALVLIGVGLLNHPNLRPDRASLWTRCLCDGSTPEIKDRLSTCTDSGRPSWQHLERVAEFLRAQDVREGEVTSFYPSSMPLYLLLGSAPSTPFVDIASVLRYSPGMSSSIQRQLSASKQRFVVNDLLGVRDVRLDENAGPSYRLPETLSTEVRSLFPGSPPIVFRSGRYTVHRVKKDTTKQQGNP